MKWKSSILIGLFFVIAFTSCKENETVTPEISDPEPTTAELLSSGLWLIHEFKIDGESIWDQAPACNKDNGLEFKSNGDGARTEGKLKCDPGAPSSVPFKWEFSDEKTIAIFLESNPDDKAFMNIISISEQNLVLTYEVEGRLEELHFKH